MEIQQFETLVLVFNYLNSVNEFLGLFLEMGGIMEKERTPHKLKVLFVY